MLEMSSLASVWSETWGSRVDSGKAAWLATRLQEMGFSRDDSMNAARHNDTINDCIEWLDSKASEAPEQSKANAAPEQQGCSREQASRNFFMVLYALVKRKYFKTRAFIAAGGRCPIDFREQVSGSFFSRLYGFMQRKYSETQASIAAEGSCLRHFGEQVSGSFFSRLYGFMQRKCSKTRASVAAEGSCPRDSRKHAPLNFFTDLFGFDERGYSETQACFAIEGSNLVANDRRFHVGSFDCLTLKALRDKAISQQSPVAKKTFGVIVSHVLNLDTVAQHANPDNSGATFQVASQFNCLEFTSRKNTPEAGISKYAGDDSQGPRCAIACAPAAVYRNYFVPLNGKRGQTKENQINNLDEVERHLDNSSHRFFEVKNGYVDSSPSQLLKLQGAIEGFSERDRDQLRDAVKVGVHSGVDVVFKAEDNGIFVLVPPEHVHQVQQVLCSGLSVSTFNTSPDDWELFARLVLEGIYEATLWAAVVWAEEATKASAISLKPRVHLTFVGAGAFANPLEWVVDAINRALNKVEEAGVGLEVIVNHWRHIDPELERAIRVGAPPIGKVRTWICPNCSTPYSMMFAARCKWDGARRPDESTRPSDPLASCSPHGARRPDEHMSPRDPCDIEASGFPLDERPQVINDTSRQTHILAASARATMILPTVDEEITGVLAGSMDMASPHEARMPDEHASPRDPCHIVATGSPQDEHPQVMDDTSRQIHILAASAHRTMILPTEGAKTTDVLAGSMDMGSPHGARSPEEHARLSDPFQNVASDSPLANTRLTRVKSRTIKGKSRMVKVNSRKSNVAKSWMMKADRHVS